MKMMGQNENKEMDKDIWSKFENTDISGKLI